MIYRAYSSDTSKLLSLPETGMGYQVIDASMPDHTKRRFVAYNAELVVDLDSQLFESKAIIKRSYVAALASAKDFLGATASITLVSRSLITESRVVASSKVANKHRYSGGKGAKDSAQEIANGSDVFVRLSAYENDRRVDALNKRLIPGTYATTDADYRDCVLYNDDPVDRYALPNDEEIKWAFFVRPRIGDKLRRGIVQPAFGHDGGGLEVLFDDGTSNGTYFEKRGYGK